MKDYQLIHYNENKEVHEYIKSVTRARSRGNSLSDWICDATNAKMKREKKQAK